MNAPLADPIAIAEIPAAEVAARADALGAVLHACVEAGASVGFVRPFASEAARDFFLGLVPSFGRGERRMLAAFAGDRLVGTAQLVLAMLPNGRHRAEVSKVLVHPELQRRGIGRRLMLGLEAIAREEGRFLLVLDTRTGDDGERLYGALGYHTTGVVPNYALATEGTDRIDGTTIMYKDLREAAEAAGQSPPA